LSNVKELDLAWQMSLQDWDQKFPNIWQAARPPDWNDWYYWMAPYINNAQVYKCPSDKAGENAMYNSGDSMDYGYVANYHADSRYPPGVNMPFTLETVAYPGEVWPLADGTSYMAGNTTAHRCNFFSTDGVNMNRCVVARHNEGANIGFVDGHAKWMAGNALVAIDRPVAYLGWNTPASRFWLGN
jgi:prepilin-type processing-associated H-X9-DG protein